MEHSRELKKPLQDLVHELKELKIDMLKIYKRLEKLEEIENTLVLQYMAEK